MYVIIFSSPRTDPEPYRMGWPGHKMYMPGVTGYHVQTPWRAEKFR